MEIETEFNKDDSVWVIHANRAHELKIESICVVVDDSGTSVSYECNGDVDLELDENDMYKSKQELIESL